MSPNEHITLKNVSVIMTITITLIIIMSIVLFLQLTNKWSVPPKTIRYIATFEMPVKGGGLEVAEVVFTTANLTTQAINDARSAVLATRTNTFTGASLINLVKLDE
jgi:hypothetical protein